MLNILITGASDGIGLAVAQLLAQDPRNKLTLVARNENKLAFAMKSLSGPGHRYFTADLSQPDGIASVSSRLAAEHYDVLINNAGSGLYGRFEELSLERQLEMMHTNMDAVVILSHHYLKGAKSGDILVNTSSLLGYSPLPGASVYSATKAFVAALSETLWWEYKDRGICVIGFAPGATKSNFHRSANDTDGPFPPKIMQSPEQVAEEMVRAIKKRMAPKVVSGAGNRILLFIHRFVSRKTLINMMGNLSPIKGQAALR